jgi:hypothetical protein
MPEKLFESENLTFNLNTLGTMPAKPVDEPTAETAPSNQNTLPDEWKQKLTALGFAPDIIEKLGALGEPFKNTLKVLGYKITNENGGNPILAFVAQPWVQQNLLGSLLNAATFRAIYNTIPERLIAHSEFFKKNEYNILYCKDLYTKSPKEMLEYLRLQSRILKTSATEYTQADINNNKKAFLQSKAKDILNELNPVKRAKAVNTLVKNEGITKLALSNIEDSKLNSLEIAKLIYDNTGVGKVHLDTAGQNKIIEAIKDSYAKIYATLLSICLGTGSKKARKVLTNGLLSGLTAAKISEATAWLAENNIITKGELQGEDADALVDKINTLLSERGQQ